MASAYYPKYPAVDAILDLLFRYGIPASNIECKDRHGRTHISVQLPGGRYTHEYIGSSVQGAARAWLNGEEDGFEDLLFAHAAEAAA